MKCKSCKREIADNSIFCNWCGKKQLKEKEKSVTVPRPRQLASGSWSIWLEKEKKNITAPTETACRKKAIEFRSNWKGPGNGKLTLGEAYDKYIESKEAVLSPSTVSAYKKMRKHNFPSIINAPIDSLTVPQIQKAVSELSEEHSPKYVKNAYGLLGAVLGMFRPGFHPNATLPQKEKTPQRSLTDEEIKSIINIVKGTSIELPVLCGLWLGMRMSEILGAEVEDIKDGKLHICRAVVLDEDGKQVTKLPKTFAGDRWVSVPKYIQELLPPSGRFVNISGQAIYKRLSKLCEKNGIAHCRFHDLRHSNAAIMLKLGIDSATAQQRNGWSTDNMYKQVYAYSMSESASAADVAIDNYFLDKCLDENRK